MNPAEVAVIVVAIHSGIARRNIAAANGLRQIFP
jgi:hypothetical protein